MAFDAPDGVNACTRRNRSNTPLQALTLLNDEAFVELAHALATRVKDDGATEQDRLRRMFRFCLAREPQSAELDRLGKLLAALRSDASEAEAWTAVARVLMNLDEFITRE
jgi:hypothetical protein